MARSSHCPKEERFDRCLQTLGRALALQLPPGGGFVSHNLALSKLVPPTVPDNLSGRALTVKEVRYLLSGPNRETAEGAHDYALLLLMLRTSIRVSESCSLRLSQLKWGHGRWVIKFKVKGAVNGRSRFLAR